MPLVDHLSVGVSDISQARKFYNGVFEIIGCHCLGSDETYAAYGYERVEFLLLLPFNGREPCHGNGTHIGFTAPSKEAVALFYSKALELGGSDEGEPGFRADYPFPDTYAAYVRDPYGNKLEIVHNGFSIER